MENHFRLAHRWGCVLLLDEADVFLAKRDVRFRPLQPPLSFSLSSLDDTVAYIKQQRDVQRNGLVSGKPNHEHNPQARVYPFYPRAHKLTTPPVFLRILEYYSGILFLTTNRVGAIDDAFRSRLHLTLYYPPLKKSQTLAIFKRNFERLAELNDERRKNNLPVFEYKDSKSEILNWVKEEWKGSNMRWNGRQIRNAFQTVLALAEFHARTRGGEDGGEKGGNPVVAKRYFKVVANASIEFDNYLKETHGFEEDKIAKRDYTRALAYSPAPERAFRGLDQIESDSSEEDEEEDSDEEDEDSEEDSDDSDVGRKKKKGGKKVKKVKGGGKKGAKTSEKKKKAGKKGGGKKKEKKADSDDSDESE